MKITGLWFFDSVELGQSIIDRHKIGLKKIETTQLFVKDLRKEMQRLLLHVVFETVVKVGEILGIDGDRIYSVQVKPLPRKAFDELPGLIVRQHSPDLLSEDCILAESSLLTESLQHLIGHGSPQEV